MGLNFRRMLIEELERRQAEIELLIGLLKRLRDSPGAVIADAVFTRGEEPARRQPRPGSARRDAILGEIVELHKQGFSLRAIGEQVRLSHAGVWKTLQRAKRETYARSGNLLGGDRKPEGRKSW